MQRLNSNYNQDLYQKAKQKIIRLINHDVYLVGKNYRTLDGRCIYKLAFQNAYLFKSWNKYYKKARNLKQSDFQVIMIKNKSKLYKELNSDGDSTFPFVDFSAFDDSYYYFFIVPKGVISDKAVKKNPFKFIRLITQTDDLSPLIYDLTHSSNAFMVLWIFIIVFYILFLFFVFGGIKLR